MKKNLNTSVSENIFADGFDEESGLYKCCECGEEFEEDELTLFNDRLYCEECLEECTVICDCCGERTDIDFSESDSEITICGFCAEECFCRCANCDSLVYEDKVYEDEFGNYLCHDCWERLEELEASNAIHKYSYKPEPIFHGKTEKNRFFGAELETDRNSSLGRGKITEEIANALLDIANGDNPDNKLYLKIDRSLKYGFELVSHPMTIDFHLNNMPWQKIMNFLIEKGYISGSSETCGLHIHVDRRTFGDTEEKQTAAIARVLMFVENNWNEVLKFSRRTEEQMKRWAARYDIKEPDKLKEKAKEKSAADRYTCVNLKNKDTVEFRIFKGTLNFTDFAAALQLVNVLCDIAVSCSDEEAEVMTWADLSERLNFEKENYKELISYLTDKKIYYCRSWKNLTGAEI